MKILGFRSGKKWKKVLASIGYVFIGLTIVTAFTGKEETPSKEPVKETTAKVSEKKETPKKKETKKENLGAMNKPFKVGNVEFTVNKVSTAKNVGGEFGTNSKGTYLILNVSVKNLGKEALMVDADFFKLLSNKNEFKSDSSAGIYANENADFFLTEVNPTLTLTGNVVFDVSQEVINDNNKLLEVQTGFWGTEKGKIKLK